MQSFIFSLFLILCVFLLPLILVTAVVLQILHKRRLYKLVQSTSCHICGIALSVESVKLADTVWSEHVRTVLKPRLGIRLRIVRTLHVMCGHCKARYQYWEKDNTLQLETNQFESHSKL